VQKYSQAISLFALLGSAQVKSAHKILVKSTQEKKAETILQHLQQRVRKAIELAIDILHVCLEFIVCFGFRINLGKRRRKPSLVVSKLDWKVVGSNLIQY